MTLKDYFFKSKYKIINYSVYFFTKRYVKLITIYKVYLMFVCG